METKQVKLELYKKMTTFKNKFFIKKYKLNYNTTTERGLQRVYKCPIHPRGSKIAFYKGFVNMDDRSQVGTHWTAFYDENINLFYLDNFD